MKQIQLDSFIYVDERQISRNKTIPYQIRFELNRTNLQSLIQARQNNYYIKFSTKILTNLRYYTLFSYKYNQYPLVFITHYQDREVASVVKTSIFIEGKIVREIEKEFISDSLLFRKLINSHYWLISQILVRLQLKSTIYSKYLFPAMFFFIVVSVSLLISFLPTTNSFGIILIISSSTLLLAIANFIYKHKLSAWILHQLAEGFFSQGLLNRKIGINLLNIISNK